MLEEAMRTIGFFCPACRQAVIVERSAFSLAAAPSRIACPCGASALEVELRPDQVRLTVPCLYCEGEHTMSCSALAFLQEKAVAFACGRSDMDCCYVGERAAVYAAMQRLEETLDVLERDAGTDGVFMNPVVMEEILGELRDIVGRDGIACSCGQRAFTMQLSFSAVELTCSACGGVLKIPAGTASDVDDLCCKQHLTIHGKKS